MEHKYTFSFEKLRVWELANSFAILIYNVTKTLPKSEQFGLVSQMTRAAASISANIAEGTTRTGGKDQARFTTYAYSSLMEVLSYCILSNRMGYLSDHHLTEVRQSVRELSLRLNNLRKYQLSKYGKDSNASGNMVEEGFAEYFTGEDNFNDVSASFQRPKDKFNVRRTIQPYFVHPTAIIDDGCEIGPDTKIWHFSHIMTGAVIGERCNIGQNVVVSPDVVLGNNVKVQNNVSIYTGVICEDDVFLGPSMVFTNVINPRSAVNRKSEYKKTVVKKGATIGANATIVCGHDIGRYAFVGAGAVVTKAVPDYALVVGNPARQIGWMSEHGMRLDFDNKGRAVCEGSGEKYVLIDGKVEKEAD